jgi:hypothetical protein
METAMIGRVKIGQKIGKSVERKKRTKTEVSVEEKVGLKLWRELAQHAFQQSRTDHVPHRQHVLRAVQQVQMHGEVGELINGKRWMTSLERVLESQQSRFPPNPIFCPPFHLLPLV